MSATPRGGEVWWAEAEDKRRPVLVVTRDEAVPVLSLCRALSALADCP